MNSIACKYIIILIAMNIISLALYGSDKTKAKKNQWRIQETTLLGIGFLGGAVGAIVGMKYFHHKTKKVYFWVINIIGLIWQTGMLMILWNY